MKTTKFILSILMLTVLIASGCAPAMEELPAETPSDVMLSIGDAAPSKAQNAQNIQLEFNLDLLKQLSQDEENIFYSSFSINQALTMACFGAQGETQQEIKDVLGYSDLSVDDIAAYQKYLIEMYEDSGDTTFYSANSLWIDDEIMVKDSYISTMQNSFESQVTNLDLQGSNALSKLNGWVKKETNGMIEKLYEQPLGDMARVVLMNAIYFKGQWTTPFDPEMTRPVPFNGINSTVETDMMYTKDEIQGYNYDDYSAISMPYGDDERFSFVAVLPSGDINDFISNLDAQALQDLLTTFESKDNPLVLLPKFEMEEKLSLNDTLNALGMNTAFTTDADFSEISDTQLFISDVVHKAKIKVDEECTEAAAVTGITFETTSMPIDQFEFIADRPFMFFILDTEDNTVLFTGVMYDVK